MQRGELSEARICATGCCTKPHVKQRGSDGVTRQELFTWIRQQYGTEPEYPWHDWNAVLRLRHNDNNKWYGVVLEVSADKLGLPEVGIIDVLNVKSDRLSSRTGRLFSVLSYEQGKVAQYSAWQTRTG